MFVIVLLDLLYLFIFSILAGHVTHCSWSAPSRDSFTCSDVSIEVSIQCHVDLAHRAVVNLCTFLSQPQLASTGRLRYSRLTIAVWGHALGQHHTRLIEAG